MKLGLVLLMVLSAVGLFYASPMRQNPSHKVPVDTPVPTAELSQIPIAPTEDRFGGRSCVGSCNGHEAGYAWAEEHDIDNEDDCDTAGDNSSAPSFADGCKDYVNEASPRGSDRDDDPDGADDDKEDQ